MKKLFMVVMVFTFVALILLGCDPRQAKMQEMQKKYTRSVETAQQQSKNMDIVRESLNAYKADFGVYPQSLEELKAQGYDVPEPSEGWTWEYRVDRTGMFQLGPVPKN